MNADIDARWQLACNLQQRGDCEGAIRQLDQLLAQDPLDANYLNLKAQCLLEAGDYDQAIACYEQLISRHPTAENWLYFANALRAAGQYDACIAAYRKAISLQADFGEAYWGLANLKTFRFTPGEVRALEEGLKRHDLSVSSRTALHFALGKAFEDTKRYAESFDAYRQGNALWRKQLRYHADFVTAMVKRSKALFTSEFFRERSTAGHTSPDLICIVGLPRSGSTLVEQILASHSAVEGTRELPVLSQLAQELVGQSRGTAYPDGLRDLPVQAFEEAGEAYLSRTHANRKLNRPFFIDKSPGNYIYLGFLHLILPKAKIIDVRRHPLASGFANYKHHYLHGAAFAFDLTEIGRYYRDYVDMMAHYDAVLPGRVYRVFYEQLVSEPESEIRKMLAYCGLPFEEACLRFYENPRAVSTPSAQQVRQPLFKDAVEQWRNYEPWLRELKVALGDVLACYPAAPKFDIAASYGTSWQIVSTSFTWTPPGGADASRN